MKARQRVKDLIELACREDTPDKEAAAAARKACRLIQKYELLESPLEGLLGANNQTVKAAGTVLKTVTDPVLVNSLKEIANQFTRARRSSRR